MAIQKVQVVITLLYEADTLKAATEAVSFCNLAELHEMIYQGDAIGVQKTEGVATIAPGEVATACYDLGSEPGFFGEEYEKEIDGNQPPTFITPSDEVKHSDLKAMPIQKIKVTITALIRAESLESAGEHFSTPGLQALVANIDSGVIIGRIDAIKIATIAENKLAAQAAKLGYDDPDA